MRFPPPSCRNKSACAPSYTMRAPPAKRRSAARISREESLCGNTRRPRSTFSGTPISSSNRAITCAGGQAASAEYKKRGLRRTCFKNSCSSQAFVKLQRPLPVISSFLPGEGICSSTVTRCPARTAHPAQNSPAAPAPIMTTSATAYAPFPLSAETARTHSYFVLYPIFPFAARPHTSAPPLLPL